MALLCAVTFVLAAGRAQAQPISGKPLASQAEKAPAARTSTADRNSAGGWWSTIGSLALVIAAILILGVLLKWQHPASRGLLPQSVVQDLGRRPLDPRNVVQLVRCGSKILVLGVGPQGLTALSEIIDPVEVDTLTGLCSSKQEAEGQPQFGSILKRMLGGSPEVVANESPDPATQRLKSRLQSLAAPTATEAAHG